MSSEPQRFPIVGIGASAGGIQALESFFRPFPAECGLAFVIVTHLSPERESLLHEIVARYSAMPVAVAQDGLRVEPGNIYVMPQNAILWIESGALRMRGLNAVHRERKPIDIFFAALAKDQGEYAVGVILSGGDGDGTLGVKAIKERGGLTLAQTADGTRPRHPAMPDSAISSGLIDFATPAEEMGEKLVAFERGLGMLDSMIKAGLDETDRELQQAKEAIYAILREQASHDFSGYKTRTFLRRVRRRMQVVQVDTMAAYATRLSEDRAEVRNLFRDLLISVTNFFRDPGAYESLEALVVRPLFESRAPEDPIRVWVPGCATGEEAYSLAILMRERMAASGAKRHVQIFATDIDEPALSVARSGRYPETLLEGVAPARRERFFTQDGSSYVVNREVRDMCIFSSHSVIRDPPFSRMDMVSCRNLLIYFGPDVQERMLPTFHYALKTGGFLFLGTSEHIRKHGQLFATLDKKHRIFQSRDHPAAMLRLPTGLLQNARPRQHTGRDWRPDRNPSRLRQAVDSQLLERFAPAHVVVNAEGDVVHYSARTGRYLEPPAGVPSHQLMTMARKGLRRDLRAALREAVESRQQAVRDNIAVEGDDGRIQMITLTVEPLENRADAEPLFLILFQDHGAERPWSEDGESGHGSGDATSAELERELRDTRERLQATIEQYETALEELKSSNEELVSINEEAQSSNEELEASKEEMQSLNEELSTINAELNQKIEELDHANSDLRNLFESSQIATIFLDRNLVIRIFTPAASTFFRLIPADIGRPLTDLAGQIAHAGLKEQIQRVFETGELIEHQLRDAQGAHYLARILPYRNSDTRIDGVVVAFLDVTNLAEAEEHQKVLIAELNHRVKNMLAVVISIAQQTMTRTTSPEQFYESLVGRLYAMARGHELLSREQWTDASLRQLVVQELSPFGTDRMQINGAEVRLKPKQGLSLAMVAHELATNAAKYGALSKSDGRLEIEWSADGEAERVLTFLWRERDGPPVEMPKKDNFGLRLIRREIEYGLGGEAQVDFAPDGLIVKLKIPLKD
ncbi:CheR family methyltransferase [Hansschlegelia sp.]|uniref:CheR family methyltransferase n=1 Tax=Hansschlegelia sp. TaxID=2041892 RepID=UPI002B88410F|nr:CheR family methyltransferase [Hansschlegelia sp.]HVI28591.1 CheR family methyltransferase [Hansschlegelia sp.]